MNENGEQFANFCAFNSQFIGRSVFPQKRIHKVTWVLPDGLTENQIDHFCISKRFRRSLEDVKVQRGADVGSDHHFLLEKIKLRLKGTGQSRNSEKELPSKFSREGQGRRVSAAIEKQISTTC